MNAWSFGPALMLESLNSEGRLPRSGSLAPRKATAISAADLALTNLLASRRNLQIGPSPDCGDNGLS